MPKSPFLQRQFLWFRLRTWLIALLVVGVCSGVYGFFFFRRYIIAYRPAHTFSVSAPEFFGSAHALGDPLPLDGNKIELLHNGDQIFGAMLEAIHAAKKSINFEAYIFYSDGTGRKFRDALSEKARAGVTVRVLLDGIGSSTKLENSDVELMKAAGCQFSYYHPAISYRLDKANRRTHRRVTVIDGRIGFTGGAGFADAWSGSAESAQHWRDVHARIEGPLVAKLQGAFQQHWMTETRNVISGADEFPTLAPAGTLKAQMTASHSHSIAPVPLIQATAIAAAEKRIWITNPYFTPTKDQIFLLVAAVKRGVDVKIIVPGKHSDQPATKAAGRGSFGELLRGGVKIFEYEPTMIHQKTMVVDALFAMFGTSNLDARSSQLNEEIDITVYDAGFGKEAEAVFEKDLQQARAYTLAQFEERGRWERFTEWAISPFRSQL